MVTCTITPSRAAARLNSGVRPQGQKVSRIAIDVPAGIVGDIEGAFVRAGLTSDDSATLADYIIRNSSVGFTPDNLIKAGVDVQALVDDLRATGLVVKWSGE